MRIVVLGTMSTCPVGGQTWLFLNWLRGLMGLGHEVWYIEDDTNPPYRLAGQTEADAWTSAADHVRRCTGAIGFEDRWAVRFAPEHLSWGRTEDEIEELYRTCDLLLNVVGTALRDTHMAAPFRVWVQTDPVTHELMRAAGDEFPRRHVEAHHAVVTYGENYGAPDCGVPLHGVSYLTTRQPVDLELWPAVMTADAADFTTIGNYRQTYKDIDYVGETLHWSKHLEWAKFIELPSRTTQTFLLGLNADPPDTDELVAKGWGVTPAFDMSLDVFGAYPDFIRRSRAEFTVAKEQNVRLRSGWFSERDACYLASGKPVVAQDTGFGNILPTGLGLFAVQGVDDAVAAIDEINADYAAHCAAARAIAEEYFEARKVAQRLLCDLTAA